MKRAFRAGLPVSLLADQWYHRSRVAPGKSAARHGKEIAMQENSAMKSGIPYYKAELIADKSWMIVFSYASIPGSFLFMITTAA